MTDVDTRNQSISNIEASDEVLSDDISTGEGEESAPLPDGQFEIVDGYTPPELAVASSTESAAELSLAEATTQLRDIGEASFGPQAPAQESVIGQDDRVQIQPTHLYPWRAHASLRITAADDSLWIGTAWFAGPRILVTAGHCVYIKGSPVPGRDGWVKNIVVMPGRNGNALPYGSATSSHFYTVRGWAQNGSDEYDYGAIILNESLGERTGWLGFGNWSNLRGVGGNISGYPGDKPPGTQWYAGRPISSATSRKVYYEIDTMGGQSGSAVYRFYNGGRYGVAIHAYGVGGGATSNSGTRINSAVFKNLKAWKEAS